MPKNTKLVIVESPAKAKTIEKYLGGDYRVKASMGHLRDLPKSRMGVDIENDFEPQYIAVKDKHELIAELKKEAKSAEVVYLATDPDREGEAISWHLKTLLDIPDEKARRVTFNEITKKVVTESIQNPRDIDLNLVDAQQARRVLDRIVGYTVSPWLWKAIKSGLSAGRVQSVAARMVVDREKEISDFVQEEFWLLDAHLSRPDEESTFVARFYGKGGKKQELKNEAQVKKVVADVTEAPFTVESIKKSEKQRSPAPPFITSTLQQEASRRINMTPRRTMTIAQQLYEGVEITGRGTVGLITYMRTDSLRLSDEALSAAGSYIREHYGEAYYTGKPRKYKTGAGAQDAHEAIRPTDVTLTPEIVRKDLTNEQYRLYRIIWGRFTASQMSNAVYDNVVAVAESAGWQFRATSSTLRFPGYTAVYEEAKDEQSDEISKQLPELTEGMGLVLRKTVPDRQFTQPPSRYTEATLIRAMEEKGIGRPSTYAPTITTIMTHDYVAKDGRYLRPTQLGTVVTRAMVDNFNDIVDLKFTNRMEAQLDSVERGECGWKEIIRSFYSGLSDELDKAAGIKRGIYEVPPEYSDEVCEVCGKPLVYKSGRFGRFLACSGFPECTFTKPITVIMPGKCPKCGGNILKRNSRNNHVFYACERGTECGFITWDVPTADYCPSCGKTLFKPNGRGALKSFCMNPECSAYLPEDKRRYPGRASAAGEKKTDEKAAAAGKKTASKPAAKKTATKKPAAKKTAAKKTASKTAAAKKTTAKKSSTPVKEG